MVRLGQHATKIVRKIVGTIAGSILALCLTSSAFAHDPAAGPPPPSLKEESFVFVDKRKTFLEANAYCRAQYGTAMFALDSIHADRLVKSMLSKQSTLETSVWTGKFRPYGQWMSVDSAAPGPAYRHWHTRPSVVVQSRNGPWKCAHTIIPKNATTGARGVTHHEHAQCSEEHKFFCWTADAYAAEYQPIYTSADFVRKDYTIPNCPKLSQGQYTWSEAKAACGDNAQCAGFTIHQTYAHTTNLSKKSLVTLYRDDAEACAQPRRMRADQYGIFFFGKTTAFRPAS